ncbi:AB-hydrolase YheT [Trametopsis cervina]|nr:AB-hydrolase YheT [Trametopsis cervina]
MSSVLGWLWRVHDVPKLFYSPAVASVTVRAGYTDGSAGSEATKEQEKVSLRDLVERRCPSLHNTFVPAWWLPNGHMQTGYCVIGDFSRVDKVEYERTLIRTVDGGTLGLDFTPSHSAPHLHEDTPIVVVLHGLTGGSHESYVRAILSPACTPTEKGGLGYRGVVVNSRGCAGVPVTSPQLYSAGHTDDIRTALLYISQLYPKAPLLGIGFSLGANILTRYLGEEGERSRIMAGCAISCPWDLSANGRRLEKSWWRRRVYSRAMATNLKAILRRHLTAFEADPSLPVNEYIPRILAEEHTTLYDFDNAITRFIGGAAPHFPFPRADDYYAWASSHHILTDIRVPHLCLNARDDPIVGVLPVERDDDVGALGPWIVFGRTRRGGHLGWFEEGSKPGHPKRWFHRPTLEWLKAMGDVVVPPERHLPGVEEVDGYMREVGSDANGKIGYKVVEGGGHVVGVEGEGGILSGL